MHVGAVMVFEGPPPHYDEFVEQVESRMHLVPRYRQKLAFPRFEMGRPMWVDDPTFNLEYHLRNTALPKPGSMEQLRQLAARIFSQRLDRSKPLWETWLVQGLEDGRFALISKTHHSLVDGVAGVDLASVLFDLSPVRRAALDPEPWTPQPEPSERGAGRGGREGARAAGRSRSPARRSRSRQHPGPGARHRRASRRRASARSRGPGSTRRRRCR